MSNHDEESLKVVDTKNVLTTEELQELKKLASLSKTAKIIVSVIFSIIMLIGVDHLADWIKHAK